jgi:hypothetical protein
MKRQFFITLTLLCLNFTNRSNAEIKNAYAVQIIEVEKCIQNLTTLLGPALSSPQRERLEKALKDASSKKEEIIRLYSETQKLIEILKAIDPFLFDRINDLKDKNGAMTDTYIKVAPYLGDRVYGLTNLGQSASDPHTHISTFGENSVLVWIAEMKPLKELYILVHELGHVLYQVPDLASYKAYFDRTYDIEEGKRQGLGHAYGDPSHKMVIGTVAGFRRRYNGANGKEIMERINRLYDEPENIQLIATLK